MVIVYDNYTSLTVEKDKNVNRSGHSYVQEQFLSDDTRGDAHVATVKPFVPATGRTN